MNCPSCGYDNKPEALTCNLCQHVLRREGRAPAPRVQPAAVQEPPRAAPPRPSFPVGLLFFGVLFALVGASCSLKQYRRATFPTYPRTLSTTEMLTHSGFAYTRFDRTMVQRDRAVFKSGASYHVIDPRVGFEAASASELLAARAKVMNNYVRLSKTPPFLNYYTLISKKIHPGKQLHETHEEVLGHRVFAPVLGGNGALWVVSPWHQTEPKPDSFIAAGAYAGTVLPLRDMLNPENYQKLQRAYHPSGRGIPADAIAVVEGPAPNGEHVSTWYPLTPAHDLFVEVPDDADLDLDYAEGILDEPLSDKARTALQAALDKRPGPRVALPPIVRAIILTEPAEFKKQRNLGERFDRFWIGVLVCGALMLGAAGVGLRRFFAA